MILVRCESCQTRNEDSIPSMSVRRVRRLDAAFISVFTANLFAQRSQLRGKSAKPVASIKYHARVTKAATRRQQDFSKIEKWTRPGRAYPASRAGAFLTPNQTVIGNSFAAFSHTHARESEWQEAGEKEKSQGFSCPARRVGAISRAPRRKF